MSRLVKSIVWTASCASVFLVASCMTASALQKIKVVCGAKLRITPESAERGDWGGTSVWNAAAHGDTLLLSRKGRCGDECNYEERIVLASISANCPSFVSATVTRADSGSPRPEPRVQRATRGTLHIQEWKPAGGIVSGTLDAELKLTFYVQMPLPDSK
jgi:hypothetical protein